MHKKKIVLIAGAMLILASACVAAFVVMRQNSDPDTSRPDSAGSSTRLPDGSLEYRNRYYKFSLQYPAGLFSSEHAEAGGGRTIVFETAPDAAEQKGFEVYVVPYKEEQVTAAQFMLDEPSGVRNDPVDVMIDGIRGTIFYGRNAVMGDTREVWFIKNGYLYEVTTYKGQDEWLSRIMATWKFL